MARSWDEFTRDEIQLPQGRVRYREAGEGPTIVLVHGYLVDGTLWRKVAPQLAERGFRVVVPDLPLGSHRIPMPPDADLTPPGIAAVVASFIEALDLSDVTLVGNDTGGAICQLVVTRHPVRIGRMVLTSCDAFERFPPPAFVPLKLAARVPGLVPLLMQGMRLRFNQRSPLAFGLAVKRPIDSDVLDAWVRAAIDDRGVMRDLVKITRSLDKRYTIAAGEALATLSQPVLVAWAAEDRFFPRSLGGRLVATIPNSRFELIEDSRTFVSEDAPERVVELVAGFAGAAERNGRVAKAEPERRAARA